MDRSDGRNPETATICIAGEFQGRFVESVVSLRADVGELSHLMIAGYVAGETNLAQLARKLGVSRSRARRAWHKALRFLHKNLTTDN